MKKTVKLPENFFLGAAASAWQTEGWSEKKESQDSYIDLWYKENKNVWHNGYGRLTIIIAIRKILLI